MAAERTLNISNTSVGVSTNPSVFSPDQFSFVGNLKTKVYGVEGMTCSHCKSSVENNLMKLDGISSVKATPAANRVEVSGNSIDQAKIEKVINDLGYDFKKEI